MDYTIGEIRKFANDGGYVWVKFDNGISVKFYVNKSQKDGRFFAKGPKETNKNSGKTFNLVMFGSMEKNKEIEDAVVEAFCGDDKPPF